jgi:hypothetical protein
MERYDEVFVLQRLKEGCRLLSISSLQLPAVIPASGIMHWLQKLLHHAEEWRQPTRPQHRVGWDVTANGGIIA